MRDRSATVTNPPWGGVKCLFRGPGLVAAPWLCTCCGSSRNKFGASNPHAPVFTTSYWGSGGSELSFFFVVACCAAAGCRGPGAHQVPRKDSNEFLMLISRIVGLPRGVRLP